MWRKQFKSKHQVWDHVRTKRLMCPQIWVLGNFMTFWHFTLLWLCRRFSLTFHWNFDHNLHQFILTYIEKCTRSECQKAFLLPYDMTDMYCAIAVAWFFNFESAKKLFSKNNLPTWENVSWKLLGTNLPFCLTLIDCEKKLAIIVSCKKYTNAT